MPDLEVPIAGSLVPLNLPDAQLAAQIAAQISSRAPLASPAFTDIPTAPTADPGTNTAQIATAAFVQAAVTALINAAPGVLDTLDELAAALDDDANFATTMTNALAGKQPSDSDLTGIAALSFSQGDILYRDGSGLQRLAAGTAGQRLETAGPAANPSWAWSDVQVLAQSAVQVSHTGDTSETTLADISIPAGTMGANDQLWISALFTYTNSANTKTLKVKLGSTNFKTITPTTTATLEVLCNITNRNSVSSQIGGLAGQVGPNVGNAGTPITGAIDMSSTQSLKFTGQLTNSGETVALEWYRILLLRAPS